MLVQELMTEPPALDVCTELTCCKCKKGCKSILVPVGEVVSFAPMPVFVQVLKHVKIMILVYSKAVMKVTVVKCLHVPVNFLCGVTLSSSNIKL